MSKPEQSDGFVFGHMQINETISTPALAEKHKREAASRRRLYTIREAAEKLNKSANRG